MKSVELRENASPREGRSNGGSLWMGADLPRKIYLELTDRCNLACSMCYRNSWDHPERDMTEELVSRCVSQIREYGIQDIVLGGIGEPCLSPHLTGILSVLGRHNGDGRRITLTTNGTVHDRGIMESIVRNVRHVVVSLDGLGEVFYKIRGISSDVIVSYMRELKRMDDSIRETRESTSPAGHPGASAPGESGDFKVTVQMVLSRTNADQAFSVLDLAAGEGIDQVIFSHMIPSSQGETDNILYSRYENTSQYEFFSRLRAYSMKKGLEIRLPARELKTERRCRFIEDDSVLVTTGGRVAPCYRFSHDCREFVFGREKQVAAHFFGNILDQSLSSIWQSPDYRHYRGVVRNNQYPSCPDCDLVDGCDQVRSTEADCYGEAPSCADCLWARDFVYCV